MRPPPSIGPRSGRDQQGGCQSAKGYPSSGGVSGPPHFQNLAALSLRPRSPNGLAIKRRRSTSEATQIVAGQAENALACAFS